MKLKKSQLFAFDTVCVYFWYNHFGSKRRNNTNSCF